MTAQTGLIGQAFGRIWWLVFLRGLVAILFGIVAMGWPGATLWTLILFYAGFSIADGLLSLIAAIKGGGPAPRWWLVVAGLSALAAGIIAVFWPGITALVLVMLVGVAAIVRGVFEIVGAIQLRKVIENEWLLILSGALSVVFGIAVLMSPAAAALALVWVLGVWAVVVGAITIGLALRLRKLVQQAEA